MGANGEFDRVLLPFGKLCDMWLVIGEAFKWVYDNMGLDCFKGWGGGYRYFCGIAIVVYRVCIRDKPYLGADVIVF